MKNETPKETSSSLAPSKGSKKLYWIIGIVVLVIVIIPLISMLIFAGGVATYFGNNFKITKNGTEVEIGSGNDKVSVNTQSSASWPTDTPALLPRLEKGEITASAHLGNTWTISIKGISLADYSSYVLKVKEAGFTASDTVEVGTIKSTTGTKDNYTVSITYDSVQDGGAIVITLAQNTN